MPHATLNLKLLRNWPFNPKLPAYAALNGIFDFLKTPLAPLGTRVLFHENTTHFCTWGPHGTSVWYICPTLEHCWGVKCYTPSTHSTHVTETVKFLPTVAPLLKTSSEDYLCKFIGEIIALLADPNPTVNSISF